METVMGNSIFTIVVLLAVVMLVLIVAVFALARQIGILHTRLAPAGALMTTAGPRSGSQRQCYPSLTLMKY